MTFLTNQAIFKVNQELLSLCASSPKVHGKIECFRITKSPISRTNSASVASNFGPSSYAASAILSASPVTRGFTQSTCLHATPQHYSSLISAFSNSFPDFDFTSLAPWNFKLVPSPEQAMNSISWNFRNTLPDSDQLVLHLWAVLEKEICPACCYIYNYESDRPDAFSEMGAVFNMNFFFLNEKMSKVVLVHLREGANALGSDSEDEDLPDDEFGYF